MNYHNPYILEENEYQKIGNIRSRRHRYDFVLAKYRSIIIIKDPEDY